MEKMMKCLTLIIAASAKRDLADWLRNIEEVEGFTMLSCEPVKDMAQRPSTTPF